MKSTFKKATEVKVDYTKPMLMSIKAGTYKNIILTIADDKHDPESLTFTGVVVSGDCYSVGYFSTEWSKPAYEEVRGKVEINTEHDI